MSDFRRRTVIAKKPYDAEIEYLEVERYHTFSIQTNILMKSGMGFGMTFSDFQFFKTTSGYCPFFGTNWSSTSRAIFFCSPPRGAVINLDWKNSTGGANCDISGGGKCTLELKKFSNSVAKVYLNNVEKASRNYFTFETGDNMKIKFLEVSSQTSYIGKIYRAFIYDSDNNKIFDAIPVRIGTIGYMYDKVSHQLFGNSGTGNFILGPDL